MEVWRLLTVLGERTAVAGCDSVTMAIYVVVSLVSSAPIGVEPTIAADRRVWAVLTSVTLGMSLNTLARCWLILRQPGMESYRISRSHDGEDGSNEDFDLHDES